MIAEQFECNEIEEISSFTENFNNFISSTASLLVVHYALRFYQLRVFQSIIKFTSRNQDILKIIFMLFISTFKNK
jgi:hypothetical protein